MPQELTTLSGGATIQGPNGERFIVEGLLATGGFSSIYLVRNRRTRNKLYVLKEISDPDTYEHRHLTFEGEILKRLEHPSLPHVHQVFENKKLNRIYLLMDYIEGSDLETLRQEQPEKCFSLNLTLALMKPVIEAVNYLHHQQPPVIHRDIKPGNIIVPIGEDEPKLVDFGLAKEYVEEKTTNVFRYGTPGYAAAEQYIQGTNPRTDIYALGATIYALLSGIVPIDALTRNLEQHEEDPLLPLYMLNPTISVPVSDVIEKAMSLRSKDRYATVDEFWQALNIAAARYPRTEPIASDPRLPTPSAAEISKLKKYQSGKPANQLKEPHNTNHAHFPQVHIYKTNKRLSYALFALLVCIIIAITTVDIISHNNRSPSNPPVTTPVTETACAAEDLTAMTGNSSGDFPSLAGCYAGTVNILGISNGKTNLFLFHIQQSQDKVSGDCNGFGTTGTFNGAVTMQGTISFTIKLHNQERPLRFQGAIGSAGELVINYNDLDQNGHPMQDEYGDGRLQAFSIMDLTPSAGK